MTTPTTHKPPPLVTASSKASTEHVDHSDRFWDRWADRYAAKPVPDATVYARKLAFTREHLHAESSVLELGCGTGSTAISHAGIVGNIRATDFSAKMIEIAQRKAAAAGVDNVEFVQSSIEREAARQDSYDAVLALSVLHLLADWRSAIRLADRQLRPGGVFVTSTPCLGDTHPWLRWIAPIGLKLGLLPQLSFIPQSELRAALIEAGFMIERCWQPARGAAIFIVAKKPC